MKSFQLILLAVAVSCASAFVPAAKSAVAFKPLAMSAKAPEPMRENKNAAAIAAFSTALAPFAANAASSVDEGTIIGYGAGLVACVVSLAVGFAIGYGTLVKL